VKPVVIVKEKFNQLLNDADVFFSNRRPGYQERYGLTAHDLCSKHPGLIHAKAVLHGETGPWSNRTGFDEVARAVTGVFALEGTPDNPRLPPIQVVCDYIVGWFTSVGIMSALRRRVIEGGSYRVVVSLTGVTLCLLSLGDKNMRIQQLVRRMNTSMFPQTYLQLRHP
jgi:crotonobetainyl-CoA:carnitine CoA-transferase CaiB-like acyl-CoA transferase